MDKKSSILQILDLFTHEQKIPHHHSDFLKFLSSLTVPIIKPEELKEFSKTFDETHDLIASLIFFHNVFVFDPINLQKILSFNQIQNKDILLAAPYIYMNCIGFILKFTSASTFNENFSIVLNSIFSVSYYDYKNSFFMYFLLLEYFMENSSDLIREDNVRLICSHLYVQSKPNIKFYNILIEMLTKVKASQKCLEQIFSTFAIVLQFLSKKKVELDVSILCDCIIQNLLNVKYQAFEVILALSKRREDDNVKKIFQQLPKSIKDFMSDKQLPISLDDNIKDEKNNEQYEYYYDDSLSSIQMEGDLESHNFPEIYDCSDFPDSFYDIPVHNFLNFIISLLAVDVKKPYLNAFMQSYEQLFTEQFDFNFYLSFLYILSKMECHYTLSPKILDLLFDKKIFNPLTTVFNSSTFDLQKIFLLRNVTIKIAFKFCKYGTTDFFKKSENWPSIFSEILLRSVKFDMSKLFNDTFMNSFCKVYFILCGLDMKSKENSVSMRPIFFLFSKFLLEIPSLPFHELQSFTKETEKLILAVISEKSFKSTIFLQMKKFLFSNKYSEFNPTCSQIGNLLILINQSCEFPNAIKEYLQMFYDAIQKNECLRLSPSSVNLFNSFITFIEHHPNEENIIKVLKILALYNKDVIDNWVLRRLSVAIPIALENNLNDEVISSLFSLVSSSSNQSFPNFLIENGKPLHFIFSIFSFFNQTLDLLKIINSICDYSVCNRIRLHESEFDILLLDILINFPNDFIFKECKIVNNNESFLDLLFEVFAKISVTKSNQIVINRLIKVICHSAVSERFLKFFIPLENLMRKYAVSKYPLGIQQLYFEADNITEETIKQGFSIAFWIFVDTPISEKLKIKATVLTGMNFFTLTICQSLLYLSDVKNNILQTFPIRSQHWNAVVLNFHDDTVVAYVNKNFVTRKIKLASLNSKNTFTFGNEIEYQYDIDELLSIYSISKFSIYTKELSVNEIDQFISQSLDLQALYSFPLDPNNPPLQAATMYIEMNGFIPKLENISDSLNYTYPIENVIPVFSQLQNFEHRILILNAIENIFQNRFNSLGDIISYLLNQNDQSIFTYDLYLSFYSFLKKPDKTENLFDSLIVNCDLWSHAENKDLIQIINHWKDVLFPEFNTFFYRKKFFSRFISELRVMFYTISNRAKTNDKEIELIIQPCLNIIELIANHDIDDSRSALYLETIIKSENYELASSLINILPILLANLNSTQLSIRIFELILCIDFDKYKNFFHALIQSLSLFPELHFYHSTIILGYNIPADFNYKYFEDNLVQFPGLSFICLKTALKTSPENQKNLGNMLSKIIKGEENIKMFVKFDMWFIWPVIFALQTEEMEMIVFFIATILSYEFSKEMVGNVFSFIDLIGVQTDFNVKELKCSLIKCMYEIINMDIQNQNQNQIDLLEFGFECLFSTCTKNPISSNLAEEFKHSPFNETDFNIPKPHTDFIYSLKDLKTTLEIDFIVYSYYIQIVNISHFSKIVKSFYHIYIPVAKNASEGVAYLHKLICSLSLYPESESSQGKDFLTYGSKLMQFISSLKRRTQSFANQLNDFFKKAEKSIQEIETVKESISDPILDVYKEKEEQFIKNKKEWKKILKKYVHPNAVFNIDCFEWKRDFFTTPDFVSNKLKRRIKSMKQKHYQYPFPKQIIINNENNSKLKEHIKNKSSQNLPLKGSSSKISSASLVASYSCFLIKISKVKQVIFNLHSNQIEIITNKKTIRINFLKIHDILTRSRYQKKTALEFFLTNGKSYLLDFAPNSSSTIFKQFSGLNLPNLRAKESSNYSSFVNNSNIIQKWQVGNITTFDLLMQLNMSCGRSFHDSENYIIFPWVVAFPESKHLRNFDRPMPAQTDSRFNYYKKKMQLNKEMPEMGSFLFGSAPSNAMLLSYYFVRIQPFTSLHLKVHDGKFDVMDRIFRSVDSFFAGMTASDDSRESVPEFYSMPEMFFDLGNININIKQNDSKSNDETETTNKSNEESNANNENLKKSNKSDEEQKEKSNSYNENDENLEKSNKNDEEHKEESNSNEKDLLDESNKNDEERNEELNSNANEKDLLNESNKNDEEHNEELNSNTNEKDLLNESNKNDEEHNEELNSNANEKDLLNESNKNDEEHNEELNADNYNNQNLEESKINNNENEELNTNNNESNNSVNQANQLNSNNESNNKDDESTIQNEKSDAQKDEILVTQADEQHNKNDEKEKLVVKNEVESTEKDKEQAPQNDKPNSQEENTPEDIESLPQNSQSSNQEEKENTNMQNNDQINQSAQSNVQEENATTQKDDQTNPSQSNRQEENLALRNKSSKEEEESSNILKNSYILNDESDSQNDEPINLSFHNDESCSESENDNILHEDFNIANDLFDQNEEESLAKSGTEQAPQTEYIGDLEVPNWSSNIYDFVYQLRKILESDELCDQINKWIDLIFGLSQRGEEAIKRCNIYIPYIYDDVWKDKKPEDESMVMALLRSLGSMPPVVFKEKIGPKIIVSKPPNQDLVFNIEYEHQIKRGFPFMTAINKCNLIAINCYGSIERIAFDLNKNIKSINSKENFLNPLDHIITLYHNTVVYIIDCKNLNVSSVSTDEIMTKKVQSLKNIEFIDPGIYEHTFFATSKTGAVYLWNSNELDNPQLVLNVFSDSLKAATVSQKFGVFVYATNNGYVEIYSLNGKRFVNSVYLDGFVGLKVVVTPKLGLIVVKTLKNIWVMTINGFVMKKVSFLHHLNAFTMWSSPKGIDFISASDLNGNVWIFEAYYPEKATIVKSCHDAVVGINYNPNNKCLLIVTMKPKLHIVYI